jgi:hypothetical protein
MKSTIPYDQGYSGLGHGWMCNLMYVKLLLMLLLLNQWLL